MNLGISGKRALICGGSSGLGFAIGQALAAEGVDLVLFARNPDKLEQAKARLVAQFAVKVECVSGDMCSRAELKKAAEWLRASGGLDILILNTARPPSPMREMLEENDDDRWREAYEQQLKAALNVLGEFTPLLVDKGWGRIIGITSATVKQPMPRHAISTIFRAGVQAALKHLANETGRHGVTVNAVAPATILTESLAKFHNLEERAAAIPLRRLGTTEEFAGTVAFIASRQAGFITGQTIQVDGGMTQSLS